jgi:hypothetical protein
MEYAKLANLVWSTMSFPWPVTDDELVLNDALDIVMRNFNLPLDDGRECRETCG